MARPVAARLGPSTSAALASNCAWVISRKPLSSAIAARVTRLVVGASLTAVKLIVAVSFAVSVPPVPVLPRSLAVSVRVSLAGGVSLLRM